MQSPELSLFVFYFIIGSYKGLVFAIYFIILFFKLDRKSNYCYQMSILATCGFIILGQLSDQLFPYIEHGVIYMFGPMSDWIYGVNGNEIILTGTASTAIITLILGLRKLKYI